MIKEKIIHQLQRILQGMEIGKPLIASLQLDFPTDFSHGDYTTNIAFQLSKTLRKSPFNIAQEITAKLTEKPIDGLEKIEAVKPGFVNFWITKEELIREMDQVINGERKIAVSRKLKDKKIFIEYAHPNTHKEMHIGHMRTLITGEALARLCESQGATVFRANYQGDIGPHVAKALYGIQKLISERTLTLEEIQTWSHADKAHFLGEGYVRGNIDCEECKEEIDEINKMLYEYVEQKFQISNIQSSLLDLYLRTRQWSLDYYDEFYTRFMTRFDKLFFESETFVPGKKIVMGNIGSVFTQNDGAVIFPGEKYGLHTRVFITKAGYPTYEGKEMGNAFMEYEAFPFYKKIHVVGSEQSGYFQVVFKALELLDPEKFKDKQYHLPMGMVQFVDRKMSSRTGDILRVDWLIDQVKEAVSALINNDALGDLQEHIAIGAIKYSVLKVGSTQNVAFDIKTSVSLEGNSGPYIQYTYARTRSILRKAHLDFARDDYNQLLYNKSQFESEEVSLLRYLYQFPEIVQRVAETYSPNVVCDYLFTLAQEFNHFYQKHRIIDTPEEQDRHFRLALTQAIGKTLQEGLYLLGIVAPNRM